MSFDNFDSHKFWNMFDFKFSSKYYEVWIQGKMIKSGHTLSQFSGKSEIKDFKPKGDDRTIQFFKLSFENDELKREIARENEFDVLYSLHDRLQYLTIPLNTDVDHASFTVYRMHMGATREVKNFTSDEPYCCNLFFNNERLSKITLSFSNPEKLIEFYQDSSS